MNALKTSAGLVAAVALFLAAAGPAGAADMRTDRQKLGDRKDGARALDAVREWLKANVRIDVELPGPLAAGMKNVVDLADPALGTAFPQVRFYALRLPTRSANLTPPAPLGAANLFAVAEPDANGNRAVTHLKGAADLQAYCGSALRAKDREAARSAVYAYCLLRKELVEDDFSFEIKPEAFEIAEQEQEVEKDGKKEMEKVLVVKGSMGLVPGSRGSGSIDVKVTFAGEERAFSVTEEKSTLEAGARPPARR